jgi:myo-inositol 2-dehydrogenase/D-chiro-inositol 1-dehydrogenase
VTVHDIDMLRWISHSEITQVYASASHVGFEDQSGERAILSSLRLASGAIAVIENGWRASSASNPQLSMASFQVHGTKGSITVQGGATGVSILSDGITSTPDTVSMPEIYGEITGVYQNEIAAFVRSIRDGGPSLIPLSEGVQGVAVAEAIEESLRSGQPVVPATAHNLPEFRNPRE